MYRSNYVDEYNLVQIRSSPEDSEYYINANYIKVILVSHREDSLTALTLLHRPP
jgi:hypothetical protein